MVLPFDKYSRIQKRLGKEYPDKGYYTIHKSVAIFTEILF